ncbi:uncharacterized protein LOC135207418 [Macrobrachium nipponense]|uniref:uncharacterized protein LOC135207418 n=1 Tax=Macrobrachium nipponense TaxID=159736 RepID=UPI0030C810C2
MAHKVCNEDGSWFRHPETNLTWSNYTTCIDLEDLMIRQLINNIYRAGYAVSLIALVISLFIFFYFRSLQCTRIRLHKNLFVSFILNNILWIVWYLEVADKPETVFNNTTGCQVLHILLHYFLVSNYYWMFSEGLYLHTLLVVAFVTEDHMMRWFYLLGWGAPAIIVAVYAGVRGTSTSDTQHCWIEESHYTLLLSIPVCLSILANLVFLINIVRVLVTKLRANHVPADTNGTRKAVRATLILIPLLGLHYVLMPFRPAPGSSGELVYQIVSALASSFQGFCVALLFCFCNSEVTTAIKKRWVQYQFIHERPRFTQSASCALPVNGVCKKPNKDLRKFFLRRPFLGLKSQQDSHHHQPPTQHHLRSRDVPVATIGAAGSTSWGCVVVESQPTQMGPLYPGADEPSNEDKHKVQVECRSLEMKPYPRAFEANANREVDRQLKTFAETHSLTSPHLIPLTSSRGSNWEPLPSEGGCNHSHFADDSSTYEMKHDITEESIIDEEEEEEEDEVFGVDNGCSRTKVESYLTDRRDSSLLRAGLSTETIMTSDELKLDGDQEPAEASWTSPDVDERARKTSSIDNPPNEFSHNEVTVRPCVGGNGNLPQVTNTSTHQSHKDLIIMTARQDDKPTGYLGDLTQTTDYGSQENES